MNCPKCGVLENAVEIEDVVERDDGGVDEYCHCEKCDYRWIVINPGDIRLKRAVIKLKEFQPKAHNIQFGVCHCRSKALMLSYQLGQDREKLSKDGKEACGFLCAKCGFGNAGWREVKESVGVRATDKLMDEAAEKARAILDKIDFRADDVAHEVLILITDLIAENMKLKDGKRGDDGRD